MLSKTVNRLLNFLVFVVIYSPPTINLNNLQMIPKVIHYCWLSNAPIPTEIQECIDSWKTNLPDFEIKKWDTKAFDVESVPYVSEAFKSQKWAFASDYIRLYALYTEGGIYLDIDVFVIKRFDSFLKHRFFSAIECYPGMNEEMQIQAAVMGSEKGHPFVKECMEYYETHNFINSDGTYNQQISPVLYAKTAEKYGFKYENKKQLLNEDILLVGIDEIAPLTNFVGKNTKLVHCCAGSWRWEYKDGMGKVIYHIKDFLVGILVALGLKKTWNWKKGFKELKSTLK